MPMSEARKQANKKWNDDNLKERYDRIQIVVAKGQKEVIQGAAAACGESMSEYIKNAVIQRMEREQAQTGDGFGISSPSIDSDL